MTNQDFRNGSLFLLAGLNTEGVIMQEHEHMTLADLCDLLVTKTTELLKMIEKKTKGDQLQPLKKEVESIQDAIKKHESHLS